MAQIYSVLTSGCKTICNKINNWILIIMAKLHEILAVERGLQAVAGKLLSESIRTFGKTSLFSGQTRSLKHFSDSDKHLDGVEHQQLEATVPENLDYLRKPWGDWLDAVAEKDTANMQAASDVVVNGKVFMESVPATTLLGMETKLTELRKLLDAIPTLPPGVGWISDEQERKGVYKGQHVSETMKEVKDTEYRTVSPATPEHPAQVAGVPLVRAIGKYSVTQQSGMMTPLHKAEHLERLDTLLKAVKKARARANEQETAPVKIGEIVFRFIRGE